MLQTCVVLCHHHSMLMHMPGAWHKPKNITCCCAQDILPVLGNVANRALQQGGCRCMHKCAHLYFTSHRSAMLHQLQSSHDIHVADAGSITLVMYLSLYFLDVEQGLSSRMQWVLGFILLTLIAATCLWFLFNIFRRKEVLVALLKSTTLTASRGLAQIKTLVKSDRLRSMVTRSTDRSTSNATLTSNATMSSNPTLSPNATMASNAGKA